MGGDFRGFWEGSGRGSPGPDFGPILDPFWGGFWGHFGGFSGVPGGPKSGSRGRGARGRKSGVPAGGEISKPPTTEISKHLSRLGELLNTQKNVHAGALPGPRGGPRGPGGRETPSGGRPGSPPAWRPPGAGPGHPSGAPWDPLRNPPSRRVPSGWGSPTRTGPPVSPADWDVRVCDPPGRQRSSADIGF